MFALKNTIFINKKWFLFQFHYDNQLFSPTKRYMDYCFHRAPSKLERHRQYGCISLIMLATMAKSSILTPHNRKIQPFVFQHFFNNLVLRMKKFDSGLNSLKLIGREGEVDEIICLMQRPNFITGCFNEIVTFSKDCMLLICVIQQILACCFNIYVESSAYMNLLN